MDEVKTLPQALRNLVKQQPDRVAMRMKDYGIWHDVSWRQYYENVKKVAMGLHALGVKRGDHVAIVGENKPEWLFRPWASCRWAPPSWVCTPRTRPRSASTWWATPSR